MTWGLRAVTVRFAGRPALLEVDLEAPAGAITAVVGGDGAGKTTLLRTLVGLQRPDGGEVRRPPAGQTGYLGATTGVYPDLTVGENLDFVAAAYDVRDLARREGLLGAAGLSDAVDRLGSELSGGMRQKLGVVMAVLHRPRLLVLDEPSTGLDPVSRADLGRLVARSAADGAAVVLSTAYLDEAQRAGSVTVLDEGRVLRSGTPQQIVASVAGGVLVSRDRPDGAGRSRTWRRGDGWHRWVDAADPSSPMDLEDAVIVASLQREVS